MASACSRQSRLSHLVLTHKLRQTRLQLKPTLSGLGDSFRLLKNLKHVLGKLENFPKTNR